jgi:putative endonuclease
MAGRTGGAGRAGSGAGRRRKLGREGETLAGRFLEGHGYRLLASNLHLRVGEIDLVAIEGDTLCFIEVRLRTSAGFGTAEESVDPRKRLRIVRAARAALATLSFPRHRQLRFDVVAIDASKRPAELRLYRDAFTAEGR